MNDSHDHRHTRAATIRKSLAVFLLFGAVIAAAASGAGNAASATAAGPTILSVVASGPSEMSLPAAGARVVVTAHVRNAITCTFLAPHSSFSALYPLKTVNCASGRASVAVPPIANGRATGVQLMYAVRASGAGSRSVQQSATLFQAAAAGPGATAALSASRGTVSSKGGSVVLSLSSKNASSCFLSSTPHFGDAVNIVDPSDIPATDATVVPSLPMPVVCNGTFTATIVPSATWQRWDFTFTAVNSAGKSATAHQTVTQPVPVTPPTLSTRTIPSAASLSSNWSGYVVRSKSLVPAVSGNWTVPTLNCSTTPNGGGAVWVGIGGYQSSGTLLQTGVTTDCVNGAAQYTAWFEELPTVAKDFRSFRVSAGDSIQASVSQPSTGVWETRLDDLTTGLSGVMFTGQGWGVMKDAGNGTYQLEGSTLNLSYSGARSAEWIVEAPTLVDATTLSGTMLSGTIARLVDYGTVKFTKMSTSLSPGTFTFANLSASPPSGRRTASELEPQRIWHNGVVVSSPSPLTSTGFSVRYTGPEPLEPAPDYPPTR